MGLLVKFFFPFLSKEDDLTEQELWELHEKDRKNAMIEENMKINFAVTEAEEKAREEWTAFLQSREKEIAC